MPKRISYKTKIVGISKVQLVGTLGYYAADAFGEWDIDGWGIEDGIHYSHEAIDEWLEKFDGEEVSITIELIDGSLDDKRLLRNAEEIIEDDPQED